MAARRTGPKFGFYLKQALIAAGLSKRKLSKLSGIPYPMVIRLSKGKANPNWKTVVKIAEAMNTTPAEFFYQRWLPPRTPSEGS